MTRIVLILALQILFEKFDLLPFLLDSRFVPLAGRKNFVFKFYALTLTVYEVEFLASAFRFETRTESIEIVGGRVLVQFYPVCGNTKEIPAFFGRGLVIEALKLC